MDMQLFMAFMMMYSAPALAVLLGVKVAVAVTRYASKKKSIVTVQVEQEKGNKVLKAVKAICEYAAALFLSPIATIPVTLAVTAPMQIPHGGISPMTTVVYLTGLTINVLFIFLLQKFIKWLIPKIDFITPMIKEQKSKTPARQ